MDIIIYMRDQILRAWHSAHPTLIEFLVIVNISVY